MSSDRAVEKTTPGEDATREAFFHHEGRLYWDSNTPGHEPACQTRRVFEAMARNGFEGFPAFRAQIIRALDEQADWLADERLSA